MTFRGSEGGVLGAYEFYDFYLLLLFTFSVERDFSNGELVRFGGVPPYEGLVLGVQGGRGPGGDPHPMIHALTPCIDV